MQKRVSLRRRSKDSLGQVGREALFSEQGDLRKGGKAGDWRGSTRAISGKVSLLMLFH